MNARSEDALISSLQNLRPDDVAKEFPLEGRAKLFAWTLTHSIVVFSGVQPNVDTKRELMKHMILGAGGGSPRIEAAGTYFESISSEISSIAIQRINQEWSAWVNVHADMSIGENELDNMLMRILYRFILKRDEMKCVLCDSTLDLTIHHIIPKQRNFLRKCPPFGRSVPTNLITLCRKCHSLFDPMVL